MSNQDGPLDYLQPDPEDDGPLSPAQAMQMMAALLGQHEPSPLELLPVVLDMPELTDVERSFVVQQGLVEKMRQAYMVMNVIHDQQWIELATAWPTGKTILLKAAELLEMTCLLLQQALTSGEAYAYDHEHILAMNQVRDELMELIRQGNQEKADARAARDAA